jgi:hypothetical protein
MKRALIIVGLLLLVLAAGNGISAQSDPFNGTWKLNPSKSKYTTGAPPKEMTFTISTVGDLTQVEGTGKAKDDSPVQFKYATPLKGGTGKFITDVPPDYDGVSRQNHQ